MPIGSGAVYVPANIPLVPGGDVWAPMPAIDHERIILKPTAPMTTIEYSSAGWSGTSRCSATGGSNYGLPVSVPIPTNYIVPNTNGNEGAVFLLADGRTIVQTQPLARCTAGAAGTSLVKFPMLISTVQVSVVHTGARTCPLLVVPFVSENFARDSRG
jgi:hypothetical protein